jgi:hypothetical protein
MSTEPKVQVSSSATKKEPKVYNAHQRAQAVLSVWMERRRPGQVCRELGINGTLLGQWEQRAMAGMLRALEPRGCPSPTDGPVLTPKLERLLGQGALSEQTKLARLDKRLTKLQQQSPAAAAAAREK